tara:strand:+ start:3219 stop:3662 length:444 start_codon:yes stop_codon:yes gene_type:complete
MATIVTRSGKGSPLTHTEMDANFTNLDADKAGYTTSGDGGTITQETSKSTAVTLSKKCGQITTHNAELAADAVASFVLTNTEIAAGDLLILNHVSDGTIATTGTPGAYALNARCAAGSATIDVTNISGGALTENIVIGFALVQARTD